MAFTRREFLQGTIAAGAGAAAASRPGRATHASMLTIRRRESTGIKILILGGTRFLGPALVESALARGHEVTLFNRGRSNPHLFPDLDKLIGDRDPDKGEGLTALKDRQFDAVLDTSGHVPRMVRASAELLAPNIKQYLFVSTISVYADQSKPGIVESDPVATIDDPTVEQVTAETYGPLKALCEQAAEESVPGRATIIRPGLIVGPEDQTDRFTYWPVRIDRGGEVLAPGDGNDPVQLIDVRDLAAFCVLCVEMNVTGSYNACGPKGRLSMAELLYGCRAVTSAEVSFAWVPAEFLAAHEVSPWGQMPVWVPPDSAFAGITQANNDKAIAKGLTFRPLADTARDTLVWFQTLRPDRQAALRAGLSAEKEMEVLTAWREGGSEGE